ncbi:cation diffusion facilitator family transporter [Candidatus Kaiserbacteria bacterium]|nr:cation diffusion facilitator family transporter [Candidatus Kaiserbacteria bacterium]
MHEHHSHDHHDHKHEGHDHVHGLVDESILRSKAGVKAVSISLAILLITALIQVLIFFTTNSVSLLADLIHNFGDALTAVPLAAAFILRNKVAEKYAGYFVVLTIFVSACVAGTEAFMRLIHPEIVEHLLALVAAGIIGFVGNEIAAVIRVRAGKRLHSAALIADGNHARVDGFVSLSVVASAILVALGLQIADPMIGLIITVVILRITWHSYQTIRNHGLPG